MQRRTGDTRRSQDLFERLNAASRLFLAPMTHMNVARGRTLRRRAKHLQDLPARSPRRVCDSHADRQCTVIEPGLDMPLDLVDLRVCRGALGRVTFRPERTRISQYADSRRN